MRPLHEIHDADELRERARLAENSAQHLKNELARVKAQLVALQEGPDKERLLKEVQKLLDDVERARATPGHKSEARPHTPPAKEKTPQKGHGPREQPKLVEVEQVHTLDDGDCACPECGKPLSTWDGQFEESEMIDVVVKQYVRKHHKRQKYKCSCGHIETALGPVKLQPNGRYSTEFAIDVAVNKYEDHLPLERQVSAMARDGLKVDSQTLWDQLLATYRVLAPALPRLKEYLRQKKVLGVDETRWPVLGKESKNWTMWCKTSDDAVHHEIRSTRGTDDAEGFLAGFGGTAVVDGYAVYPAVAKAFPTLRLAFCWAHVRRHFLKAETAFQPQVDEIIGKIQRLFAVEHEAAKNAEERLRLRREKSRPITDEIKTWLMETSALPESSLRKAMEYTAARWTGLTRFLDDAEVPLTNNGSERALRGPVVGRKNHYGSKSEQGTQVAALFYSLFESAALCHVDQRAYLRFALDEGLNGGVVPLPHEVAALHPEWRLPDG